MPVWVCVVDEGDDPLAPADPEVSATLVPVPALLVPATEPPGPGSIATPVEEVPDAEEDPDGPDTLDAPVVPELELLPDPVEVAAAPVMVTDDKIWPLPADTVGVGVEISDEMTEVLPFAPKPVRT